MGGTCLLRPYNIFKKLRWRKKFGKRTKRTKKTFLGFRSSARSATVRRAYKGIPNSMKNGY